MMQTSEGHYTSFYKMSMPKVDILHKSHGKEVELQIDLMTCPDKKYWYFTRALDLCKRPYK